MVSSTLAIYGLSATAEEKRRIEPYGSWKSPITSELIVSESIGLGQIAIDGESIYWIETRPSENGRSVIVCHTPEGATVDITPTSFNARTRVHEYGGGAFTVDNGVVYFSNFADQRLYRQYPGEKPLSITPKVSMRYADGIIDCRSGRMICIREDHTAEDGEVVNTIVGLDLDGSEDSHVLVSGNDFYSSPRLSSDGSSLAWITWNHPNMPWDGTELWVADLMPDGSIEQAQQIAGGVDESIFQPEWSPDGILHFVSDRTGWWNIYRWHNGAVESLCGMEAEFGLPQWLFGYSTYAFESAHRIIYTYTQHGSWQLASINVETGEFQEIPTPYTRISQLRVAPGHAIFIAGSTTEHTALVKFGLDSGKIEVLRRSSGVAVDPGYLSVPEDLEFPTEKGMTAYAFFYPPVNRDFIAPFGELPPLIVMSHGGPTGATSNVLSLGIQYWTSRGFAVLDVNYGDSTGYGREYRQRLKYQWGIVDVDDCVNGAKYLVERGEIDDDRIAITGGSAGGYTTLCALTFRNVFSAGASYYGICDAEALARETHKFESRYLDGLIGSYPAQRALYQERSPINSVDQLSCPVIFFQGLEDEIVPPNQAEMMVEALRRKGVPVAYLPFEGEQHGFRRAENIKRSLDAELYFYSQVFGFQLPDQVEPVEIENL